MTSPPWRWSFALAALGLLGACVTIGGMEPWVDPARLAAYEVTRPGEVLFRREARAAVLAATPPALRARLCGSGSLPMASLTAPEAFGAERTGGTDTRLEPFSWALMHNAASAFGTGDGAAAEALLAALDRWAREGALARLDNDEPATYYALDRMLLPAIVSFALASEGGRPDTPAEVRVRHWLAGLVERTRARRAQQDGGGISARNNHSYLDASVLMAWGALTGDDGLFRAGPAAFERALWQMRPDGSLPLETARGARALWYQRHAIASLVAIAEMAATQGQDLYALEIEGRSLHRAVDFLLDASVDPAKVLPYARADENPGVEADWRQQDLGFLARRGHGRHYMAWAEAYMARFPGRMETRRLRATLERADPAFRPMIDDYAGGNATCFFADPGA
ncbi:alginate lyase family protein [Marinimicrococcus flavescens]|uniref:Alginate lyase family protein n=1 Tax=Marinimicrococcus flavescens TaxID=3031815 RepID=A0AAP3XRX4_9PROT|nr:alginate lyase family protein [Marinimicrococcus flavescens]